MHERTGWVVSVSLANMWKLLMQDHLNTTDTDGQRVQEFIQSLQPTQPIIRNDFSHLGLPPQQQGADNWDNISVTSVSAQAVPYTQVKSSTSNSTMGKK